MDFSEKKVAFYTLGCKLNFSETSTIARQFEDLGFKRVSPDSQADIYVINTCSVTNQADKKCRQAITRFIHKSPDAYIAVIGCYAQLKPEEIAGIEGVDIVLGSSEKFNIPLKIDNELRKTKAKIFSCDVDVINDFFPAYSTGDRTRSFLKIQDGCDYRCSYCTIPLARGKSRNMPVERIAEQAREVAIRGTKEIILTGVNSGDFGKSTNESFYDLITTLEKVEGIERFRISSIEPNLITSDVISFVAGSAKFLPHFHIPLQSGSNKILGLMKRRYNRELFAEKIAQIRKFIPNVFIGIDVIVGFPGESDQDFKETYHFLEDQNPAFIHLFPYSERPNTPSVSYNNKVFPGIIKTRMDQLTDLCHCLHRNFYDMNIGRNENVLFESTRKGISMFGFTGNYIKAETSYRKDLVGKICSVKMVKVNSTGNMEVELI